MSIKKQIQKLAAEKFNSDLDKLQGDENFTEDLGLDSLDQVEFLMQVEDEFDIEITDEEGEKLTTVNKYVEYLESHKNEGAK